MDKDDRDHFKTIAEASSKLPTALSSARSTVNSASDHDPAYLLQRARLLFACYRRDEATDPETYCAAVAAVLGDYSEQIINHVTDPRTGLPNQQKFLPNIAEIREALDARAEQIYRLGTYEERIAEQLRLRDEWKGNAPSERLKAAGRAWLDRTDPKAQQLSGQQPRKVYSEAEKEAFFENAKKVGREISGMKLRPETLKALKEQDELRSLLSDPPTDGENK